MGWTSYFATHYKDGKIDRLAECRTEFGKDPNYYICKDCMRGATYYAAVANLKTGNVFALIVLTSVKNDEFYYKDMDETCGPTKCDCPKSILDLLSETDNEYALNWRKRCLENIEKKKSGSSLNSLPVGTRIKYKDALGNEKILVKHPASYQFKRPFWKVENQNVYIPKTRLPKKYEIL